RDSAAFRAAPAAPAADRPKPAGVRRGMRGRPYPYLPRILQKTPRNGVRAGPQSGNAGRTRLRNTDAWHRLLVFTDISYDIFKDSPPIRGAQAGCGRRPR